MTETQPDATHSPAVSDEPPADHGQPAGSPDPDGHGAGGHVAGGHDGHAGEALGPVDITMWSVGILGVAVGLLICLCFAFATGMM